MENGVYLNNVFGVVPVTELKDVVVDYSKRKSKLISLFSEIPQRATEHSAGYDLAIINDEIIPAHSCKSIYFGHSISVESYNVTAVVVPRSSLAKKKGLILAGGPQYVYFGNKPGCLSLSFINYTNEDVILKAGDKIAQVIFIKYPNWISDYSVLPDPLDEMFMSPVLTDNIEGTPSDENIIDQVNLVSYNFQSPKDVILVPGKVICIMTGLRCKLEPDQVFILKNAVNNSCVYLANSIGVIDSDYYDNIDNGGEIGVLLINRGNIPVKVNAGDVIATGAIYYYEKVVGDSYGGKRVGGFGSTDAK